MVSVQTMRSSPAAGSARELDFPYSLAQVVDRHLSILQKQRAVGSGLDAFAATVKEPHAKRSLQRSDRIGNGRLGYVQLRGRFYHAAVLNHGKEDVEVAQSHATTDARFPVRPLFHKLFVMLR